MEAQIAVYYGDEFTDHLFTTDPLDMEGPNSAYIRALREIYARFPKSAGFEVCLSLDDGDSCQLFPLTHATDAVDAA